MSKLTIQERLQILERAAKQLKQDFVGLDDVIDQIIHFITPWYALPELQERPLTLNLWGLTGTGKTDLVRKLIAYIAFEDRMSMMDVGRARRTGFIEKLDNLYKHHNGEPHVIVFDEFQHARTRTENGSEKGTSDVQVLWDIFDTGKLSFYNSFRLSDRMFDLWKTLKYYVKVGVKAKNGKVSKAIRFVIEDRNENRWDDQKEKAPWFIPDDCWDDIYDELRAEFDSQQDLNDHLKTLDEKESLKLIELAYRLSLEPKVVDCSKSLVIVIGNLDEAYGMSQDMSSERSANNIRKRSQDISISTIKQALLQRFRAEQISRLGNNHVIYPAFGEKEYREIIRRKLSQAAQKLEELTGLRSDFKDSVYRFILAEGVTPAQGARPLFSTIRQTVEAPIPSLVLLHQQQALKQKEVLLWKVLGGRLVIQCSDQRVVNLPLVSLTEKRRKPKKDDHQALVAVHESGHALLEFLLFGQAPEQVVTRTTEVNGGGFMERTVSERILNRGTLVREVAVSLGGAVAEEVLFGKDALSFGSESDILSASQLVSKAVKDAGIGVHLMAFSEVDRFKDVTVRPDSLVQQEIKQWLDQGRALAQVTLQANREGLVRLSRYLSDHSRIDRKRFQSLMKTWGIQPRAASMGYRMQLFSDALATQELTANAKELAQLPLQLNKKNRQPLE